MSAPSTDFPALGASTSSSGYSDGLGRRALAFDREDGTMLERLVVRPELAAFEPAVRERIDRLATVDDERIARPRAIERDGDGALVVVSEFVPGSRLSDLLDTSVQQGAVPGVDVALGYLLDVLPALCALHAGAAFPHGTVTPGRTMLSPAGQVVLLDAAFGGALGRLHYSRRRLWIEFGIALPPSAGAPQLDESADVAQCAMAAVMLVTGRPIGEHEFPGGLAALVNEVVDVAMIRGSSAFAKGLQNFLQRALPLPGRKPYPMTDEAAAEIRQLAMELGLDACRRALADFIEQMESAGEDTAFATAGSYESAYAPDASYDEHEPDLSLDEDEGTEVDLDAEPDASVYDLSSESGDAEPAPGFTSPAPDLDRDVSDSLAESASTSTDDSFTSDSSAYSSSLDPEPSYSSSSYLTTEPEPEPILTPHEPEPEPDVTFAAAEPAPDDTEPEPEPLRDPEPFSSLYTPEPPPEAATSTDSSTTESDAEESADTPAEQPTSLWRRRKRTKSLRARKDKLRSTTAPAPKPPAPAPPAPAPAPPPPAAAAKPAAEKSSWLVPPNRAASFDPPVPEFQTPAPPVVSPLPVVPAPVAFVPPAPPPVVTPQVLAPPAPATPPPYVPPAPSWTTTPRVVPAPPAAPPKPAAPPIAPSPAPIALKLKDTAPKRPVRMQPSPADIYSSGPDPRQAREDDAGAFPWKLAVAVLAVVAIAIVAGRYFLTSGSTEKKPPVTAADTPRPGTATRAAAPAGATGRIQVETQPSGARVLLDGKAVGESPLTLESVPVGRHTLTFISGAGSVPRTVRVEAGRTLKVDVSIFSGWVAIFAPIVLDVAENGRSIGTTEQERLMLPPGRHQLTVSNRALGYSSVQTVDIEPGQVRSLTVDPRGDVNFNALPWAEVWIDGQKAGETPIANMKVTLGIREIVFKHPQFGERRTTITVKGNAPAAVVMDMTR